MIRDAVIAIVSLAPLVAMADDRDGVAWHTYAAFRNDAFTELDFPVDDVGFTHDSVVSVVRARGDLGFGGAFMHRWLTSNRDFRRWDQLDLLAVVDKRWLGAPVRLDTRGRLGPTFGGNFGGRQNGWHELSRTGGTLEHGSLADDYPGDRRVGLVVGGRGRAQLGEDRLHGYGIFDGQAGLGAGVSSIETALGGSASTRHVGAHLEIAVTRYRVTDPLLALPGGYGSGWQLEWRVGVHVAWSRFRVSYQYRANEGGSGEPIGVLAFESVRR